MMFDEEAVNAFSGGYKISESGIVTLFGLPSVSNLKKVIAFPVSLYINSLVRKSENVVWRGVNSIELPFKTSRLSNDWYDPIKLMTNIAIQRGWKNCPEIRAEESLGYALSLGYYSAFVDLLIESFSLVNDVTLSASEFTQISGEIQDRVRGQHYAHETIARRQGKEGNMLFYDTLTKSYKDEIIDFEPFSMFLISENSLSSNNNFLEFTRNFKRFNEGNMMNRAPESLRYPFVGIRNHLAMEVDVYGRALESFYSNDVRSFVSIVSQFSQSMGYNLGVLSDFQRTIAKLIEKYSVKNFVFNVSEYSGSVLVFADSIELSRVKENVIREYFNLTNRTIRLDELSISNGSSVEPIRK